ncbi:GNAT family N-acetyltransferase [Rhodobacterales bacterium HKCCE2091]|nr:GNAT family N-acetyltransferase [Rhodobacterales bacterium HKCCE2091]
MTRIPRCTEAPTGPAAEAAARHRAGLPVLETARLRLRIPTMDDLPVWTSLYVAHFDERNGGAERAWEEFNYYTAGWLLHGHGMWCVERKSDGAAIGFVLLGLEWSDDEPELGYMLVDAAQGQGFATEAVTAARDHAMALFGPGGFVSYIDPDNAASEAMATRLGAERDRAEEARVLKEEGEDVHIWRHGVPA